MILVLFPAVSRNFCFLQTTQHPIDWGLGHKAAKPQDWPLTPL